MPEMNGIDALITIRNEFPDGKVIAGAQAYLLKNTLHKELLETIRAVHTGKKTLSPEASYRSGNERHISSHPSAKGG